MQSKQQKTLLTPNEIGGLTNTRRTKWLAIIKSNWFAKQRLLYGIEIYHSKTGYNLTIKNAQVWKRILREYNEYLLMKPKFQKP